MNHVSRYILRQVVGPLAFITVALCAVVWLTQSLSFVDLIINRGLSAFRFVYLLLLLSPGFLMLVLPIALFSAILYTYHRLTYDSELVVMRAAGLSSQNLAMPALVLGGIVVLLSYAISLYLMPLGFRTFKDLQFTIRSNQAAVLLQEGEFNQIGDDITVFIRERGPNGELRGILVHDNRDPARPVTLMAEEGMLLAGERGPRFVLFEGNQQERRADQGQVQYFYFGRYALDLEMLGGSPETRWREPAERFLPSLLFPEMEDRNDRAYANELRAEGHNRIVAPLYALVLAAIAASALLSGEFNRRGESGRITAAAIGAVLFEAAAMGMHSLITREPALTPLLYLLPVATLALTFLVMRVRRWPTFAMPRLARAS